MSTQPNIILILTDDHGAWALGCYGNTELQTPAMDRLAAQGVRFTNALTPSPVCSPARACLLTGRTPSQVGIHDWLQEAHEEIANHNWLADEITLPQILGKAGYYCALSGKWHLGGSHQTPPGFDDTFGLPGSQGAHNTPYTYVLNNEPLELQGNKSQHITDHAIDFLKQAPQDKPFFLNVGYIATHSPYEAKTHDPKMTELYDEATFADIPPYHPHPWHQNEGLQGGHNASPQDVRSRYQGYYAAVTEIDQNLQRIIDHLEQTNQLDNTIIIYTSDHGCALGHQGFWGKGNSTRPLNMHEVSLKVPLLIRHPKSIATGHVEDRAVDHYDTFKAICQWAGADLSTNEYADRAYPGTSYAPMIQPTPDPSFEWDQTKYGEYGDLRMIRTPQYKYVKRYPTGPYDLFNLKEDANETLNHAGWAHEADMQQQLDTQLTQWYRQHETAQHTGLKVKQARQHNHGCEAWRDGRREARGLQVYD
ncbi:MAG: sulfatase-like hydrolase/transferase [Phycisphaeraceae bacterium]|nr:sulfatase-like hydrolase/transferase [Phycisphaeraceae bacterium]